MNHQEDQVCVCFGMDECFSVDTIFVFRNGIALARVTWKMTDQFQE
jgi:3-oxoacyl-(acyl-carrier-protein) synthase